MELTPISGYEGVYSIDTYGNVYRVKQAQGGKVGKLKWSYLQNSQYPYIRLRKDGKYCCHYIHRLVAETFIPNPENKQYVDHIDTNKQNNHISNLRWATALENSNNPLTKKHHIESVCAYHERKKKIK